MRAVAVASTGFLGQAQAMRRLLGIEHVPIAEYPGTIPVDSEATIRRKAVEDVLPAVIEALTVASPVAPSTAAEDPEPGRRATVFSGDLDAIAEHFDARMWSDGLPVVPPTVERVEAFMAHTPLGEGEVLGVLAPEYREATIWSVAVNGVMAGCLPQYMPVLVAAVEAIADPQWRIQDAGSTPGWEPLVVLSGPAVRRLQFNTGSGLMRMGSRPAATIGRFLRLYMRNVAGFRVPPGTTDKGSIGAGFNVVLAEDDEAVATLRLGAPARRPRFLASRGRGHGTERRRGQPPDLHRRRSARAAPGDALLFPRNHLQPLGVHGADVPQVVAAAAALTERG